jgi:hypothetical protein
MIAQHDANNTLIDVKTVRCGDDKLARYDDPLAHGLALIISDLYGGILYNLLCIRFHVPPGIDNRDITIVMR